MKLTWCLLALFLAVAPMRAAGLLQSDAPFTFSGSGAFGVSELGSTFTHVFSGSGTNGTDQVGLYVENYFIGGTSFAPPNSLQISGRSSEGWSPNFLSLSVNGFNIAEWGYSFSSEGGGIGFLDPILGEFVLLPLSTHLTVTSYVAYPYNAFEGEFIASPGRPPSEVPEPSTILLSLGALAGLVLRKRIFRRDRN